MMEIFPLKSSRLDFRCADLLCFIGHMIPFILYKQAFQRLQSDGSPLTASNSTPRKPVAEEVYESEPVVDEDESAWREVAERIDPQGTLKG